MQKRLVTYTVDEIPDCLGRVVIRGNGGGRIYKNVSPSSLERVRRLMEGGGFIREIETRDFEFDEWSVPISEFD